MSTVKATLWQNNIHQITSVKVEFSVCGPDYHFIIEHFNTEEYKCTVGKWTLNKPISQKSEQHNFHF